jgi:hypothetical protein
MWLTSEEYLSGHANITKFDFYDFLAESNPASSEYNMLRDAYRTGTDSHPNQVANQTIGPLLVVFIIDAIEEYKNTMPDKEQNNSLLL